VERVDALREGLGPQAEEVLLVDIPPELINLEGVRRLPVLLAGFLAVLAIGAVAHALLSSVRSRRSDFAVLRSLGMTRRETRWVLHSQSSLIALVGLLIGIPLGLVVGRTAWSEVAASVPLAVVLPLALAVTLLVIPAGLLVANVAAWWPGHRLRRLKPAEVLRAEG
jgi:ABC-type lipoprotein release transport system permease subunit